MLFVSSGLYTCADFSHFLIQWIHLVNLKTFIVAVSPLILLVNVWADFPKYFLFFSACFINPKTNFPFFVRLFYLHLQAVLMENWHLCAFYQVSYLWFIGLNIIFPCNFSGFFFIIFRGKHSILGNFFSTCANFEINCNISKWHKVMSNVKTQAN